MLETLIIVTFGTITLLLASGMTAALLWAAARDGEMDRRAAGRSAEADSAPDTTLPVGAHWAVSFEE